MSKMDFDLIQKTSSFINAIKDRQLDFRSLKLARIENLTLTKDQNDTLDFTDNDLRILENFPLMTRVKTLLCANNRIAKIELDMYKYLPNLRVLMLNNNHITELGDLIPLENLVKLQIVSILDNPVVNRKYYRQFIVHKCPSIRILDFERVTDAVSFG